MVVLTLLSAAQVGLGAFLISTGFGAEFGLALIAEGVADVVQIGMAAHSREFAWSSYIKQKAVSLVISGTTAGWNALKNAGKAANAEKLALSMGGDATLKEAGQTIGYAGKAVGTVIDESGSKLCNLILPQIGTKLFQTGVQFGMTQGLNYLVSFKFEKLKNEIREWVQNKFLDQACGGQIRIILKKFSGFDKYKQGKKLNELIQTITAEAISPSFWQRQWLEMGKPLTIGLLSQSKYITGIWSILLRVFAALEGLKEISVIMEGTIKKIESRLSEYNNDKLQFNLLLSQEFQIEKSVANEIAVKLIEEKIIDKEGYFIETDDQLKRISELVLPAKFSSYNEMVVLFLLKYYQYCASFNLQELSETFKTASDMMAEQIIQIIESNLQSPLCSLVAGLITTSICDFIQDRFIVDEKNNSIDQQKDKERLKELKAKSNLTPKEKEEMLKLNCFNTIEKQILGNAKDYTIAFEIRSMKIGAMCKDKISNSNSAPSKEVTKVADDIQKGEPADAAILEKAASEIGLDVVFSDGKLQLTEEQKNQGYQIVYFKQGELNEDGTHGVGHYYVLDEKNQMVKLSGGKNDCGYAAIAYLAKKVHPTSTIDAQDVRNIAVKKQSVKKFFFLFLEIKNVKNNFRLNLLH